MFKQFVTAGNTIVNIHKIAYINVESREIVLENDSVLELENEEFDQLTKDIQNDNEMLGDLVGRFGDFALEQLEQLEQAAKMRAAIRRDMGGPSATQTYQAAAPTQRVRATDKRGSKPRG